jgi:hypothetical protein
MSTVQEAATNQSYSSWRLCVWAGWVFLVGYLLSWGILGFNIPTISPAISINDLYAHYVAHSARIRLAMGLSVFFMPFYFVFSAVISRVMQQIEGQNGPLAIVEQMGGAVTVVVGQVAGISWLVAAFRVDERTPEMVRQLHDFGWLYFDMTYMVTTLQMWAMAYVFLHDRRTKPLVPAWVAWLSVFVGFTFLLLTLLPFFLTGPFAWNGLFNYWITLGSFFVWVIIVAIAVSNAINRLEREGA